MPSSHIKIPGTLQANGSDEASDPPTDNATSDNEGEGSDVTESEEYDSDLDPDVPHYPEGERPLQQRRQEENLLPPDELLVRSQRLAMKFAARKQHNNAMRQLVRQTALTVLVYGPQHFRYASAYAELARGYLDYKGPNYALQAEEHAAHAKNILLELQVSSEHGTMSELDRMEFLTISLATFHTLGRAQSLLKKFNDAEQSLLKAEKLLRELSKLSSATFDFLQEMRIKLWTSLAKINSKLAKPAVSISYYEKAIDACQQRFGPDALELIPLYQGLGNTEQSRPEFANHERAIDMYLKAHEIATARSANAPSAQAADTARALSMAYGRSGVGDSSAESYLQESLAAYLQLHGPEHPIVCEVQDEIAKLLIRSERADEGAKMLKDTLKVKARVFGDFSTEVQDSYRLLGSLWLSRAELDKALTDLQRAREIAEFLHGPNSRIVKDLSNTIDTVLKHPSMEGKQVGNEMKSRPRFNGIVGRSKQTHSGGSGVF